MSAMRDAFLAGAAELLPEAVALRRRIHMHPELGNELPETRAAVLGAIDGLDLDVRLSASTSGVVATLRGARPGPTILLRGDMDALPMPEDTGLDFASRVDGRMHACGHDSHTAMLAGAAMLLARHRDALAGAVRFMFQPGEEGPGGAQPMIDEGILDAEGRPDAAFALHVYPNRPSGLVMCRPGPILAGADTVAIRIVGRGGHGSMPYDALDPVPVACELVQAFQTFVTRRFSPFDPVVLTVGRIAAGTVDNVIPEHAEMAMTLRSFSAAARERAQTGIRRLAAQIAAAHEMRAEVDVHDGYPPTLNDAAFAGFVGDTARAMFGAERYLEMDAPLMGAEDFSHVLARYPGAFAFLGAAPPGAAPGEAAPCHSNRMTLDESAMATGIALHAAVAWEFLHRGG